MALFTDSNVANVTSLSQLDSEVPAVVAVGNREKNAAPLNLSGPNGLCNLAWVDCRSKLEATLTTYSTLIGTAGGQAHQLAVNNVGGPWGSFGTHARVRLSQIVASDSYYANSLSPIQLWVNYAGLRLVFQELENRFAGQDKADRYEAKRKRYEMQETKSWSRILSSGLPFVQSYFDCPGSLHGWNAGIWDNSALSYSADPNNTNANDQPVRVAITYVDATVYVSPLHKHNGESGPSEILSSSLPANSLLTVSIAGLNPPNRNTPARTGLSQGIAPSLSADYYQVYVGPDMPGAPLWLQSALVPMTQTTVTLPATLLTSGYMMDAGQVPTSSGNLIMGNPLLRG